jgi:hypothetical protein
VVDTRGKQVFGSRSLQSWRGLMQHTRVRCRAPNRSAACDLHPRAVETACRSPIIGGKPRPSSRPGLERLRALLGHIAVMRENGDVTQGAGIGPDRRPPGRGWTVLSDSRGLHDIDDPILPSRESHQNWLICTQRSLLATYNHLARNRRSGSVLTSQPSVGSVGPSHRLAAQAYA